MPRFCAVINCGSRGDRDKKSFYRLPAELSKGSAEKIKFSRLRRQKWLVALRRSDLTSTKLKYMWICENHFVTGKPAELLDVNNPDWIPNQNMGYIQHGPNTKLIVQRQKHSPKMLADKEEADPTSIIRKPAELLVVNNLYWIPNQNMGYMQHEPNTELIVQCHKLSPKRLADKDEVEHISIMSNLEEDNVQEPAQNVEPLLKCASVQTDMKMIDIENLLKANRNDLTNIDNTNKFFLFVFE